MRLRATRHSPKNGSRSCHSTSRYASNNTRIWARSWTEGAKSISESRYWYQLYFGKWWLYIRSIYIYLQLYICTYYILLFYSNVSYPSLWSCIATELAILQPWEFLDWVLQDYVVRRSFHKKNRDLLSGWLSTWDIMVHGRFTWIQPRAED